MFRLHAGGLSARHRVCGFRWIGWSKSEHDGSGRSLSLNVHRSRVVPRRELRAASRADIPGERGCGDARLIRTGDRDRTDLYACRHCRHNENWNARGAASRSAQRTTRATGARSCCAHGAGRDAAARAVGQGSGAIRYPCPHSYLGAAWLQNPCGLDAARFVARIDRRVGQQRKTNYRPCRHGY